MTIEIQQYTKGSAMNLDILQYPGAIYHVMHRNEQREPIARDDEDRRSFEDTLTQACAKTGWQIHAYCLTENHCHLVVETPKPNLVVGTQWLLGAYTTRFNRRHQLCSRLFTNRYKTLLVSGTGAGYFYLKTVCDYVHLTPARSGLLKSNEPLQLYPWSSYPQYTQPPSRRPSWMRVDRLLQEWQIAKDDYNGRKKFQKLVEQRRSEDQGDLRQLRRAGGWGSPLFREKLLETLRDENGESHYGQEVRDLLRKKAEGIVREELKRSGLTEKALAKRGNNHPVKVRVAARLRQETTLGWRWIADRLHMGHWRTAADAVLVHREVEE